jgi:hypothetical protein
MPNVYWSYTSLVAAMQEWPVHNNSRYIAQMPTLIGLGERRLWGDLNIEEYDVTDKTTIQAVIGQNAVSKPADLLQVRMAGWIVAGKFKDMELRSMDYCQNYANGDPGLPLYYAELTPTQIFVSPTPDVAYQAVYRYMGAPSEALSPLVPSNTTWLSRVAGDALLAACLAEAELFIKADDRYQDYMTKYSNELLPRLRAELRNSIRRGDRSPLMPGAAVAQ